MLTQALARPLQSMGRRFLINTLNKLTAARWLWVKSASILLLLTSSVDGQSALDGFDPNANGTVRDVVVQRDGKILLSGSFTTLSPNGGGAVTRNNIARLNADGTLDTAFDPNANGVLYALTVQPDGKILVGGLFTSIGGQSRNRIARLDPTTGLADSFDPNANSDVYSIIVQPDGKVLAAGLFTNIGGATRNHIARLDATTGLADSFDPNASNSVTSIVLQADGKIVAGGAFSGTNSIGGASRSFIARLDSTTGLADSFDPNANSVVFSLAVQVDGKILVGGDFNGANSIGGAMRNHIARLDPVTGLADSFDPNSEGGIASIALQGDGKILVGGDFNDHGSGMISIGGATRNYIARLDPTTGLADSFDPNANSLGWVYSVAVQADGKILLGGAFTTLKPNGGMPTTRNHVARLESDGRLDQTLDSDVVGGQNQGIYGTAKQPNGKILIGGHFSSVLGVSRRNIARLNTDGTLDTAFNPNADNDVIAIAVQADGKILVGGHFTSIGGQARNRIARLDASTGLADSFDPNAGPPFSFSPIYSIVAQPDGKILIGGSFTTIAGQVRNHIARLDGSTGLPDSFDPNANGSVYTIGLQADGKILVGGYFTAIGGQMRNGIARLEPNTGLADSFNPNALGEIDSIAVQADRKILVGGVFISIGGQERWRIARLDPTTGLADSFDPHVTGGGGMVGSIVVDSQGRILVGGSFTDIGGQARVGIARLDPVTGLADSFNANSNNHVFSITLQADGKILTGGWFTSIGGQPRNCFARLSADTVALQDLSATQSAIVWTREGSSPLCSRVTFEFSNDEVNYTSLGHGTSIGSNWTLTGLDFPTGQSLYIRARGYQRGGHQNGSESITESVRNVFIPVPASTPTPTPAPINIAGNISYCSNPVSGPVANVTLTLTGATTASTLSDASGSYIFASLPSGGSYTVTPTKGSLPPGATGIDTVDVVATQRHFLIIGTPLSGCRITAADVNADNSVNTIDVVAIQRFFLALSTGTANVGKYQFIPASRTYQSVVTDQTGQNYDTIVFGDVAPGFVHQGRLP